MSVFSMDERWGTEPNEEETIALLEKATAYIRKRRMEMPAVLALEMHKPLASYAGNMAIAFAPFVAPIFGPDGYRDYSRLLQNRHNVERLISMIEESVKKERPE